MEPTILRNLLYNQEYVRTALPYLKEEYFVQPADNLIFRLIHNHIDKYNKNPTRESLALDLEKETISEGLYTDAMELLENLSEDPADLEWLVNETETFCKDKALFNALKQSVSIVDGSDKNLARGSIPEILKEALAISFDPDVGHDYLNDPDKRYDDMHCNVRKIPFDIAYLNKITNGGVEPKSLNIILAGTNVGKSLFLCHDAAHKLALGHKVLYVTYEMAESKIGQRIDANLMHTELDDFMDMSREEYMKKFNKLKETCKGELVIKEFPAAMTNVNHLRHLLSELQLKRDFEPDIIYIDYINLLTSSRLRYGSTVNSYLLVKAVAEEVRGLAQEYNLPIMTATQTNRGGQSSSDLELDDTGESFGLPQTADFMLGVMVPQEMVDLSQWYVKQLKNRYKDKSKNRTGIIGVDYPRMKLYDIAGDDDDDPNPGTVFTTNVPWNATGDKPEWEDRFDDFR